jgi:hypothetical protein
MTRRALIERAAVGGAALSLGGSALVAGARAAGSRSSHQVGLPSAAQVRADFQRMVDFGPRLTGSDAHNRYIDWLEREFVKAGCRLLDCDMYQTSRWLAETVGLDILQGPGAGPVKVASYFPRSQQTPAAGVTGPLVYAGTLPGVSLNGGDVAALEAALQRYPSDVASWAMGVSGSVGGSMQGSVAVVDLPMPPPLTQGILASGISYYNGQGETVADLATEDYKRLWTVPGLVLPLDSFTAMGVAGVVFIVDSSYQALNGCYAPFEWFNEGVPALYVDRDTGDRLRALADARPNARLTLSATRTTVPTATVNAILPGQSSETIIFDSHTDGTGFVEENGGVALVHLARYFGALPQAKRPRRTLVFAAWPGHFSNDLPQAGGWIKAHPDLVGRAAAALTIEHLGCTEWNDSTASGYHSTGRAELMAVWATQGKMSTLVQDTVIAHDLPRTAVLRPPAQFGVGGPFQTAGIPQIGAIAGPEYLLTVSETGDMEKLDATLAARQIAWLADLATRLDPVPAADLREGDPTLGGPSSTGNIAPSSAVPKSVACGPAAAQAPDYLIRVGNLVVDYDGYQPQLGGLLLGAWTTDGAARRLEIELLHKGRPVCAARFARLTTAHRRIVLRAHRGRGLAAGRYELLIRLSGSVRVRHPIHIR